MSTRIKIGKLQKMGLDKYVFEQGLPFPGHVKGNTLVVTGDPDDAAWAIVDALSRCGCGDQRMRDALGRLPAKLWTSGGGARRNPSGGKSDDKRRALHLAADVLSQTNPTGAAAELEQATIPARIGTTFRKADQNISSLDDQEWIDALQDGGEDDPDRIAETIEELASWGCTDEV